MTTADERIDPLAMEFAQASDALLLKSLDETRSFAEIINDYRRLEADFEARMGERELDVLEMKRTIAGSIFSLAHNHRAPFEVCREAWDDLLRLGFSSIEAKCLKTPLYADCCAYDERPEDGLAVVEPLLAELEQRLEEARATQRPTRFYESEIERMEDLRDELEAQKRGEATPWRETRRADEAYQPTPEEERANVLYDEFSEARLAVFRTYSRSQDRSFADIAHDYRRAEAELVARAGTGEVFDDLVLAVRQQIAEYIFDAACRLQQPFDVCRQAWNEVVRVGFSDTSDRWRLTERYAESCARNDEPEAGLAVVEPLMAEITRLVEEPKKKLQPPPMRTRVELERRLEDLRKLRDKLEALRKGAEPST